MQKLLIIVVVIILALAAIFFLPTSNLTLNKKEIITEEFDIIIYHTRYEPNSISVNQGSLVKLNVLTAEGTSTYMHGITIDNYDINELVTSETTPKVIKFIADKKGTFTVNCGTCLDGPFGRDAPDKRMTLIVN